jgi:hypothetical protein
MFQSMTSKPPFEQIGSHRIPRALAQDPPFRFLLEAFEGRSQRALDRGQKTSAWKSRQEFLDLVNKKVPASDVASLVSTSMQQSFCIIRYQELQQKTTFS